MRGFSPARYPSPLRYPGGKGKVANFIKLLMLENGLVGLDYVEPYAGGSSVALSLLFEDYAAHIHINDIDRSVHAFWNCVLHETDELCERIVATDVTMAEWQRQHAVQAMEDPQEIDLAFSTFFLNRTNRSGIIGGGVIGGQDQAGPWKIDARYNKRELVRRIRKIARFRTRITVTRIDAYRFLEYWTSREPPFALLYLDPPYYVKGEGLYENSYQHRDHVAIAERVQELRSPWVVSYDAAPNILALYQFASSVRYSLSYSAADRHRGSEVMFFSDSLKVPNQDSPAGISVSEVERARHESHV